MDLHAAAENWQR